MDIYGEKVNRWKDRTAAGVPYYQYAGRTGGKPVGSNHRCKEEYPVLQILLYDY